MAVKMTTGGQCWAVIDRADRKEILATATDFLVYAINRWQGEKTTFLGLSDTEEKEIRKEAERLAALKTSTVPAKAAVKVEEPVDAMAEVEE